MTNEPRLLVLFPVLALAILLAPTATGAQPPVASSRSEVGVRAEGLMRQALGVVRTARAQRGGDAGSASRPGTEGLDAPRAALIGAELSPLMSTLGSLESKRLATDPRWAGLLVGQLAGRGIREGSVVLASFSGSFPGLNLAVMAACRAMGVRLVAISSVTASTWGADEPGFTWPEIEVLVSAAGVMPAASVAISLGATRDAGRGLPEGGLELALAIQATTARALGASAIPPGTLSESIARRLQVYRDVLAGVRPAAYVNVGGNHASLGGAQAVFRHEEGWLTSGSVVTREPHPSVTEAWLAEGVPVLNLLDVKTLARLWGLQR